MEQANEGGWEISKGMVMLLVTFLTSLAWVWVDAQGLFKEAKENRHGELSDPAKGPGSKTWHLLSKHQEMSASI